LKIVKLSNFLTAIHFPPKEGNSNPFTSYLYQKGASTILIDSCAFHNSYDLHKFLQASSLNPDAIISVKVIHPEGGIEKVSQSVFHDFDQKNMETS
jgi:hypothetical protein